MSHRHLMRAVVGSVEVFPYLVLDDVLLSGMSLFAPEEVFPSGPEAV